MFQTWFTKFIASATGITFIVALALTAVGLSVASEIQAHKRQSCVEQWANSTDARSRALTTANLGRSDASAHFDQTLVILLNDIPTLRDAAGQAKFVTDLQTTLKAGYDFNKADQHYRNTLAQNPVVSVDLHC